VSSFFLLFSSVSASQQLYEPDLSLKNEQEGYNEAEEKFMYVKFIQSEMSDKIKNEQ
jgi:hypothetical protein